MTPKKKPLRKKKNSARDAQVWVRITPELKAAIMVQQKEENRNSLSNMVEHMCATYIENLNRIT